MAIDYDFYQTSGALKSAKPYHVRIIERNMVTSEDIARNIQANTSLNIADVKGALSALSQEITDALSEGSRVHIEGLGYFTLSLDGDIVRNKNGQLRLQSPHIRTIRFLPEEQFVKRFQDIGFSCQHHNAHLSQNHDEESIERCLQQLLQKRGFFTSTEFAQTAHLTRSTSYRILKHLIDNKTLINIGTSRQKLYTRSSKSLRHE